MHATTGPMGSEDKVATMRITAKLAVLALGVVLIVVFAFIVTRRSTVGSQTYSTAASLKHEVAFGESLQRLAIKATPDWRLLSDNEYKNLVRDMAARKVLDVGLGEVKGGDFLVDPWGQKYEIAIRLDPAGGIDVVVSSSGPERRRGTADDIGPGGSTTRDLPQRSSSPSK